MLKIQSSLHSDGSYAHNYDKSRIYHMYILSFPMPIMQ